MRNYLIFRLLVALPFALSLLASPLMAAEVKGLYEAEMQVPDQSRSERGLAMSAALAEVVAKVSGQHDARLQPKVSRAIGRPAQLLQQYRYRPLPASQAADAIGGDDPQLVFFRFDKPAVDKLLRDNGLPVWGATRPSVLAWLAVDDDGRRFLLSADDSEALRQIVEDEAQRRGLPLLLPLLDLQDQQRVSFADVWGRFREPVLQASQRYRPEAVLMGRLYRSPDGDWQAEWWLSEKNDAERWQANGVLSAEVVADGVANTLGWLAARYAGRGGHSEQGHLRVTVAAVRSLADFARVEQYLSSLQQVAQVRTRAVNADRVEFVLALQGQAEGVAQTIALGQLLVADSVPGIGPERLPEPRGDSLNANGDAPVSDDRFADGGLTEVGPQPALAPETQYYLLRH